MRNFFKKNKAVLIIIIFSLIITSTIYFLAKNPKTKFQLVNFLNQNNCQKIPPLPDKSVKLVTKILDGDTFLIEGGYSVRILGIDADEKGYPCYEVAKNKLEELILNKKVRLEKEKEDLDQYCRYLRHVFLADKNIALELVKAGLAVARFLPGNLKYKEEIETAEKLAKEKRIGCKWGELKIEEKKNEFYWEKLTPELTGLKLIDACQAKNYYKEEMLVEGKIVNTYRSKTNTVFLNFEKPYPNQCFTGVIFSSDQKKFIASPETYYLNKTVRIRGEIKEYKGKPQIILKDPSQIEVGK